MVITAWLHNFINLFPERLNIMPFVSITLQLLQAQNHDNPCRSAIIKVSLNSSLRWSTTGTQDDITSTVPVEINRLNTIWADPGLARVISSCVYQALAFKRSLDEAFSHEVRWILLATGYTAFDLVWLREKRD